MELKTHCGTVLVNGKRVEAVAASFDADPAGFTRTRGKPTAQADEIARAFPGVAFVRDETGRYMRADS